MTWDGSAIPENLSALFSYHLLFLLDKTVVKQYFAYSQRNSLVVTNLLSQYTVSTFLFETWRNVF